MMKTSSASMPYFRKMPCSLAIHSGSTLLLMAPWAIKSFVGSAASVANVERNSWPSSAVRIIQTFTGFISYSRICLLSVNGRGVRRCEKSGLRFPSVHRDSNELSRRIVNSHFSKATVPGLLRRIALSACGRSFQSPFHIFHLKAKVVDPFPPATRRQDRHIDVSVGKIDCPLAIVSHWPSPGLGHAEGLLIERRGFLLILHLNRDMFDLSHRLLLLFPTKIATVNGQT